MHEPYLYGSLTRISNLSSGNFEVGPVPRAEWEMGDYVVGESTSPPGPLSRIELPNGRMSDVIAGDLVVGALGKRHATLEVVGDYRLIGEDGRMQALTAAGLFGKASSVSALLPPLNELTYLGHVLRRKRKVGMRDFAPNVTLRRFDIPTVLIIGTSMHAGKTTAAKLVIRHLKRFGMRVVATKLTGAGRFSDLKSMSDAGADAVFDFVDVCLPSSVVEPELFRPALGKLLSLITRERPDVLVAEAGASPFEPYNGDIVLEEIHRCVRCTLLCSLDPYAVLGVMKGFGIKPDLIAGVATGTTAGVELINKMTGVPALNLLETHSGGALVKVLRRSLDKDHGGKPKSLSRCGKAREKRDASFLS